MAAAGTAQQIVPAGGRAEHVIFQADPDNTDYISIAGPEVHHANKVGVAIAPGGFITFGDAEMRGTDEEFDLSKFWFDGAVTGDWIRIVTVIEAN